MYPKTTTKRARVVASVFGLAMVIFLAKPVLADEAEPCDAPPSPWVTGVLAIWRFSTASELFASYTGVALMMGYDWKRWRFGLDAAVGFGVTGNGGQYFLTTLSAAYFLLPHLWSPFVGLGAGFTMISPRWQAAMGFAAEPRLGVEGLRDRPVRLHIALACTLPGFIGDFTNQESEHHTYIPVYRIAAGVVW